MDTITDFHFLFVPWFMLSMFRISWKWLTADTVQETLRMNSCFSCASSMGQKNVWPEDVRCGTAIAFSVRRSLHRAWWLLIRRVGDLMNWLFNMKHLMNRLFNVKHFRGVRFYTAAARTSQAGWWDIVANAAVFSDVLAWCWPKLSRWSLPPKSRAAAGPIAVSQQGWWWMASSEL